MLYYLVKNASDWLRSGKERVVAVHCDSGKDRTGTSIAAILQFMGYCDNIDECIKIFNKQRFTDNEGVSQPCQLRYCYYFDAYYRGVIKSPAIKKLRGIQIDNCPDLFFSGGWEPSFSIYHCEGLTTTKVFQHKSKTRIK